MSRPSTRPGPLADHHWSPTEAMLAAFLVLVVVVALS
jgi:hypothetical protein